MNTFKNIYMIYLNNIMLLTLYDQKFFIKLNNSNIESLNEDENYTSINDYRNAANDIFQNFVCLYGYDMLINELIFPKINEIIKWLSNNAWDISGWAKLENYLYIFLCVVKNLEIIDINNNSDTNNDKDEAISKIFIIFKSMFDIDKKYLQILRTVCEIVDSCSKFFSLKDKEIIKNAYDYLQSGLNFAFSLPYCSNSLRNLLSENKDIMCKEKNELINLYHLKLEKNVLKYTELIFVIEGIATVLAYSDTDEYNNNNENETFSVDYDYIKKNLVELLKPWITYLQTAIEHLERNKDLLPDDINKLGNIIKIIISISKSAFNIISKPNLNIMLEIFKELWNNICYLLITMSSNINIVDNLIELIKIYIQGLEDKFIPFIQQYCTMIITNYNITPLSSYLFSIETLISYFSKSSKVYNIIQKCFNDIYQITFNKYIKNENDLNNYINIAEDYFKVLFHLIRNSPLLIFDSEDFPNIIKSALSLMNTQQIQVSENIMAFLDSVISFEETYSFTQLQKKNISLSEMFRKKIINLIKEFSPVLCEKILNFFVNVPTEQVFEDLIRMMKDFIKYHRLIAYKDMEIQLNKLGNNIMTDIEKKELLLIIKDFLHKEKDFDKFMENLINKCVGRQIRNRTVD